MGHRPPSCVWYRPSPSSNGCLLPPPEQGGTRRTHIQFFEPRLVHAVQKYLFPLSYKGLQHSLFNSQHSQPPISLCIPGYAKTVILGFSFVLPLLLSHIPQLTVEMLWLSKSVKRKVTSVSSLPNSIFSLKNPTSHPTQLPL